MGEQDAGTEVRRDVQGAEGSEEEKEIEMIAEQLELTPSTKPDDIQPRFWCFLVAHNHPANPKMYEFMCWISARWREWESETGRNGFHDDVDHHDFDLWLERRATK